MFKGITKRWMLNTLSVIFTIIVLIVVSLIFVITYVYQSSVEQTLSSAGNELSLVFNIDLGCRFVCLFDLQYSVFKVQ